MLVEGFQPVESGARRAVRMSMIGVCDERGELADRRVHRRELSSVAAGKGERGKVGSNELLLVRLIGRLIGQVATDDGEPKVELCANVPSSIRRRCWKDLVSQRDEILQSDRHRTLGVKRRDLLAKTLPEEFSSIDLLEIFGQLLINRFRMRIHRTVRQGRIASGWTRSALNQACQPDLHQCSFDLQMR